MNEHNNDLNDINTPIISNEEFILKRISYLLVILLFLEGCNILNNNEESESTEIFIDERVQSNANKWNRIKPNDFDYVFQRECYCITEYTLPVYLSVRDGRIVKAYHRGELASDGKGGFIWTVNRRTYTEEEYEQFKIERLFKTINDGLNQNPENYSLTFDDSLSFPIDVFFDFYLNIADDEIRYKIFNFTLVDN